MLNSSEVFSDTTICSSFKWIDPLCLIIVYTDTQKHRHKETQTHPLLPFTTHPFYYLYSTEARHYLYRVPTDILKSFTLTIRGLLNFEIIYTDYSWTFKDIHFHFEGHKHCKYISNYQCFMYKHKKFKPQVI